MGNNLIHASIVTPEEVIFEGDVSFISLPGREGSMGILPGHMPMVCQLEIGVIKIIADQEAQYIAVQRGYIEYFHNNANILTGKAIRTTYRDQHTATEEVKKKHDIVQEISQETRKVIEAIGSLRRLRQR